MRIVHRRREAIEVLELVGPCADLREAPRLRKRVDELVRLGNPVIVLDLTGVARLDSSFVGELVACRERVRRCGGVIKLALTGPTLEVFRTAGLDRVFEIFGDQDEAVESFDPETMTFGVP